MKFLCSMLMLFSLASCALAQASPDPSTGSNVVVIEKKWRIDVRNPMLDKNPIDAMNERERAEQQRIASQRTSDILGERGMPSSTTQVPDAERTAGGRGMQVMYVYELKLTNTAAKPIRTLIWEYVFFEKGTETEAGRRRFVSKVNIGPGKTTNISARSLAPPARTLNARQAAKKPQEQYSEQIVIQSVHYADGSLWRLPAK